MSLWFEENWNDAVRFALRAERTVACIQSPYQRIEVFDSAAFGRVLALDSILMTSERDEFFYHEMIVHPALTSVDAPRDVLIIGGGDGGTAREVLRHPGVARVTMVEIDAAVIEVCKAHLPTIGGKAWTDPRLEVQVGDGIAFAKTAPAGSFDVVILDGADPVGPSEPLFNEAFYEDVRRILRPHGVFSLQSESPMLTTELWRSTQHRLRGVFRDVNPCFAPMPLYSTGVWSWTIASDGVDPRLCRADRITPPLAACKYYTADIHRAAFIIPPYAHRLLETSEGV